MGNRAVIATKESFENNGCAIYLHWNGGRDSVEAFLTYCKLRDFRPPETDCYGWARLCQVIANFFGADGLSIGIDKCCNLDCDNYDNGVYIIENWEIIDRKYHSGFEQNEYDLTEMLIAIDEAQPINQQLGKEFLTAEIIPTSEVKIGDEVYISTYGGYEKHTIIGFENGVPYVNMYGDAERGYTWNCNNFIKEKTVRIVR